MIPLGTFVLPQHILFLHRLMPHLLHGLVPDLRGRYFNLAANRLTRQRDGRNLGKQPSDDSHTALTIYATTSLVCMLLLAIITGE